MQQNQKVENSAKRTAAYIAAMRSIKKAVVAARSLPHNKAHIRAQEAAAGEAAEAAEPEHIRLQKKLPTMPQCVAMGELQTELKSFIGLIQAANEIINTLDMGIMPLQLIEIRQVLAEIERISQEADLAAKRLNMPKVRADLRARGLITILRDRRDGRTQGPAAH